MLTRPAKNPRAAPAASQRPAPTPRYNDPCYASGIGRTSSLRARSLRATSCRTFFLVSVLMNMTGWPSAMKLAAMSFR